mmetsp:Transcript_14830/g.48574  ORF Transcript_14830/g.48574 Transcript_14830/m.48574 type:complete len:293 (+) Transcript_14830:277-1155(+)
MGSTWSCMEDPGGGARVGTAIARGGHACGRRRRMRGDDCGRADFARAREPGPDRAALRGARGGGAPAGSLCSHHSFPPHFAQARAVPRQHSRSPAHLPRIFRHAPDGADLLGAAGGADVGGGGARPGLPPLRAAPDGAREQLPAARSPAPLAGGYGGTDAHPHRAHGEAHPHLAAAALPPARAATHPPPGQVFLPARSGRAHQRRDQRRGVQGAHLEKGAAPPQHSHPLDVITDVVVVIVGAAAANRNLRHRQRRGLPRSGRAVSADARRLCGDLGARRARSAHGELRRDAD